MEFLWELAFTIALSLFLPLVFLKLLSVTPNFEAHEKPEKVVVNDHNHGVKSDSQSWETDEVVRIVKKIDEFRDKPILGKLIVPEIVDLSSGSPKIHNSEKVDDNRVYNEIELVDLAEESVVGESNQGVVNIDEVEVELMECDCGEHKIEEVEMSQCEKIFNETNDSNRNQKIDENRGFVVNEDDWEGIERTELETRFGAAVVFVGSKINANIIANLSNEVKMKLHGYHRIVAQGPCHEPQPMALKFSARAKWIAWRQLGIMSPEQAMEQYISLLSESIPDWMAENPYNNAKPAYVEIHASA